MKQQIIRIVVIAVAVLLIAGLAVVSTFYFTTPVAVRSPKIEHAHFRMQIITNDAPIDFAAKPYQKSYEKGVCSADLTKEPIHFHDQKGQLVHLHWKNMTGGLVLKNYGWNFIGGPSGSLGYRFDQLPGVVSVPIHASQLPTPVDQKNIFIYTGNEISYTQHSLDDFINQPLEQFFDKKSNFPSGAAAPGDDELTQINNLLGNVVIFNQSTAPTKQQITARFDQLAPLEKSTCGG